MATSSPSACMPAPITDLSKDDLALSSLCWRPHRSTAIRRAEQFLPGAADGEAQTLAVECPWGGILTARRGDYVVSERDRPDDRWVVSCDVFESTYELVDGGGEEGGGGVFFRKRALTYLVPLVDAVAAVESDSRVASGESNKEADVHGVDAPRELVENRVVKIHTLEGPVTVPAEGYFLARGAEGEIWPYPADKVREALEPVDEGGSAYPTDVPRL